MARTLVEWLDYIEQQHPKSIELGLERVREVTARMQLGKPARNVITVGGTNGKGSTVAFIEAIAHAAGWKVGSYTSPHLLRYNERVRIDGREAIDAELVAAFEAVEMARLLTSPSGAPEGCAGLRGRREAPGEGRGPQVAKILAADDSLPHPPSGHPVSSTGQALLPEGEGDSVPLTYFEFGTLAALWLFQKSDLDLAVLEVGLGGRLDAVNLVDPDVAVITTVDIDHVDWLGNDRESIGYEKAGIARAWKPLVLGEIDSPSSVLRHAYAIGANAIRLGSDFFHEPVDEKHWRWRDAGFDIELPIPKLIAPVQRANAATAIAALRALDAEIPEIAFAEGVASATLPGRLQQFQYRGTPVVVDVGHNPQAARELAAWLPAEPATGRTFAVFAALADKDVQGIVGALEGAVSQWFLAGLESVGPRGQSVDGFATRLADTAAAEGSRHVSVQAALKAAQSEAQAGDRILVFGSFHTAAEALAVLHSGQ
ncbi:MAG TPA: folylpolyglutamate synthase/dihydrofolate synthase family protein [Pseudoxanthomonas sp.]